MGRIEGMPDDMADRVATLPVGIARLDWEWRDSVRHWDQSGKAQAKLKNDDWGLLIFEVTVRHAIEV